MSRTREENAADLMAEEAEREARVSVYVIVAGAPSNVDDGDVPGTYLVRVDPDLTSEEKAEAALELFHENNGIEVLDDFEIEVRAANGDLLPRMVGYEAGDLGSRGDYIDFYGDEPPEAVRVALAASAVRP